MTRTYYGVLITRKNKAWVVKDLGEFRTLKEAKNYIKEHMAIKPKKVGSK